MRGVRSLASRVTVFILLIGAACTGGEGPVPSPSGPPSPPPRGGSVTLGLDDWPQCLNPITACAETPEQSTLLRLVLPKLMWIDQRGHPAASPLIETAPSLENGGLT